MMNKVSGSATTEKRSVEELIENLPIQVRGIMETIRAVAKANMPGAHEFVYHDAINYKFPESPGTWICYVTAQKNYVRLGFYLGTNLPDPKELLEGTGKRMRHVKIRTTMETGTDELAELIRQAWSDAANLLKQ